MTNEEFNPDCYGRYDHLVIWRGSPVNLTLVLQQPNGDPVDLSNLGPFTCPVRRNAEGELVINLTVVETDLPNGTITLTATDTETANLDVCKPVWALKDTTGYRWVGGVGKIEKSA